jgi:2-hydroxychromene-2-carboxylate isomerase
MPDPLLFYFDLLSPYAYIAWHQIHGLAERYGRSVQPVPTLLAALLAHGATKGPAEIPAKRVYVFKDALRSARRLGLPLVPPPTHPFNPLVALRAASVVEGEAQRRLIDGLFAAVWGGGGGAESAEAVQAIATAAGLDGAALVAAAGGPAAKAALRSQTEQAIAAGVFGVPSMIVDGELFWGYDSFAHLEGFLRGEDPVQPGDLERWANLPASAARG